MELILALGKAGRLQKGGAYSVESTKKPQNSVVSSRKEVSKTGNQKINSKRANPAEENGLVQKQRSFPKIFAQRNGRIPDVHDDKGKSIRTYICLVYQNPIQVGIYYIDKSE